MLINTTYVRKGSFCPVVLEGETFTMTASMMTAGTEAETLYLQI